MPTTHTMRPSQARLLLQEYTIGQIHALFPSDTELTIKTIYLGNQCARGDYEKVEAFVRETEPEELKTILNNRVRNHQTCLHTVLYWNTGADALRMFQLLVEHGAKFVGDGYGNLPWQVGGYVWVSVVTGRTIESEHFGMTRNEDDFTETHQLISAQYAHTET